MTGGARIEGRSGERDAGAAPGKRAVGATLAKRAVGATPRKLDLVIDGTSPIGGFGRIRVAMVLTDPRMVDNPIVYVNSAFEEMTGYARSAVIGRNCRFLQGEGTAKRDVDRIRAAIEQGRDVSVDIRNYRADGQPFLNRLIIAPIGNAGGELLYFLGIQKELGEDERSDDAGRLLDAIRARVREDLSLVLTGLGEAREEAPSFEAMTRRFECLELVHDSIRLADRQGPRAGGIDLGALLSRVGAGIAHGNGRPGIRYQQVIEPALANLEASIRLSLLVSEVLDNAFRHAFDRLEEGVVELRLTRLAGSGLRVAVADDGVGLAPGAPFPDPATIGGRLVATLADGLDATITPVRGAAGTIVMIDVPTGVTEP